MFTVIEGGGTDLRSVPEQSLADSIFSLEEGNVQNLDVHVHGRGGEGACVSYGLSASGALLRTRCSRPVRLAICFSMASIRSLQTQEDHHFSTISNITATQTSCPTRCSYLVSVSFPSRGEPKPPAPPPSPPGPAIRQSCSAVRPNPGPGALALGLSPNTEEVTESLLKLCLPGEPLPGMELL